MVVTVATHLWPCACGQEESRDECVRTSPVCQRGTVSLDQEFRRVVEDAVRRVVREELARTREPTGAGDAFLSVADAGRLAAVAPCTIRAWLDAGKLRQYQAGRVFRVRRSELLALLEAGPSGDASVSPEALADRDHARAQRRAAGKARPAPGERPADEDNQAA
jgi:excisionase family DNA binding protein